MKLQSKTNKYDNNYKQFAYYFVGERKKNIAFVLKDTIKREDFFFHLKIEMRCVCVFF